MFALRSWFLLFKDKDGSNLYSRIIDVIKFACKFICVENSKSVQSFAKLTWPRISDLVITHFLSKVWFFLIYQRNGTQELLDFLWFFSWEALLVLISHQLQSYHCGWLVLLSSVYNTRQNYYILTCIIFIKHLLLLEHMGLSSKYRFFVYC